MGELSPIRCIRVKTNVDLLTVRINGIKYYSQDLESKLFVPERNKIIIDTYLQYANFLIIQSFVGTVDQRVKQQKLLTSVIIVPTSFISLVTNYLLPVYNIKNAYEYNTWLIFFQFIHLFILRFVRELLESN